MRAVGVPLTTLRLAACAVILAENPEPLPLRTLALKIRERIAGPTFSRQTLSKWLAFLVHRGIAERSGYRKPTFRIVPGYETEVLSLARWAGLNVNARLTINSFGANGLTNGALQTNELIVSPGVTANPLRPPLQSPGTSIPSDGGSKGSQNLESQNLSEASTSTQTLPQEEIQSLPRRRGQGHPRTHFIDLLGKAKAMKGPKLNSKPLVDAEAIVRRIQTYGRQHWGFTPTFPKPIGVRAGYWRHFLNRITEEAPGFTLENYLDWLTENETLNAGTSLKPFFTPTSDKLDVFLQTCSAAPQERDSEVTELRRYFVEQWKGKRSVAMMNAVTNVVREHLARGETVATLKTRIAANAATPEIKPWEVLRPVVAPPSGLTPQAEQRRQSLAPTIEHRIKHLKAVGVKDYVLRADYHPRGPFRFEDVYAAVYGEKPFVLEEQGWTEEECAEARQLFSETPFETEMRRNPEGLKRARGWS